VTKLLSQIEAQLAAMTAEQRHEVVKGIRSIIAGCFLIRGQGLKLTMGATGKAIGKIMIWAASESLEDIMGRIKVQAREVGPHVSALFDAI
jgi:hypothetical protein